MTSQIINLDLIPQAVPPILHVKQYDKGQTWIFNLRANSQAFDVPAGSIVTIQGTKADHTGFQYECTYSGSTVTATETQQMTVYPGDVPAEISITNNNQLIASINFIIRVDAAALADDTIVSETDLPMMEEAIEAAQTIIYYAENFIGYVTDEQYAQIQQILT